MTARPRVAIVGSGISGLGAAHALRESAEVTVFESDTRFGGHAHTVDVTLEGVTHGVDTGFLVFNHRTYPRLSALFAELEVETAESEMSFSVQAPRGSGRLEWSGTDLNGVFADRRNLLRPDFHRMLFDLLRFNRLATRLARSGDERELRLSVANFLDAHRFGAAFREGYLLPMIACIWSCPTREMLRFPIATLIRFCHNHGLLQITGRPQWRTVAGGSRRYVEAICRRIDTLRGGTPVLEVEAAAAPGAPARLRTAQGVEWFDEIVLACHSDQALRLLSNADDSERGVLGAIRYQANTAVLHTDIDLLPRRPRAWAAWNYERSPRSDREQAAVCLHYLINRLQPLPWKQPVIVSLNPVREPAPHTVLRRMDYDHPVFDQAAIDAQKRLPALQGRRGIWYCGAWTGYGFHEDGLDSGLAVAQALKARLGHPAAETSRDA